MTPHAMPMRRADAGLVQDEDVFAAAEPGGGSWWRDCHPVESRDARADDSRTCCEPDRHTPVPSSGLLCYNCV